jgi:hypothetical protein
MQIHWSLSPQQADQILNILAQRPFAEVNGLIAELMRQANEKKEPGQLRPVPKDEPGAA